LLIRESTPFPDITTRGGELMGKGLAPLKIVGKEHRCLKSALIFAYGLSMSRGL